MTNIQDAEQLMVSGFPGSPNELEAKAKFLRIEAEMQERIAIASESTASSTKRSVTIMMWSVIVLAISSLATLYISYFR